LSFDSTSQSQVVSQNQVWCKPLGKSQHGEVSIVTGSLKGKSFSRGFDLIP